MIMPRARFVVSLAMLAATAAVASAEPLDLGRVSAKAVWMMHVDMDAARESTVVKQMYERAIAKHPQLEGMMGMGAKMMGMDVRKDLHDMTVYGLDTDKKNAVMIVHADANRGFLEKMVEKARDHETMKHRDYTLHAWTQKGWKSREGQKVVGAFYKDNVMIFARSADRVEMALDVLDGKQKSVDGDSPLAGRTRPGSILVGRAKEIDPNTKCPVLKQGRSYRVAMGENEGKSFYRARLEMDSAEAAEQAEDVTEGLVALAKLGMGDEKDVMKLVDGLETKTDGTTCMIAWDADADDVWKVAERMAEKMESKMAARRKAWGSKKDCGKCGKDGCGGCGGCGGCEQGKCPMEKKAESDEKKDGRRPFRDDEF